MRFPSRFVFAAAALAFATVAHGAAEQVRSALASRLQSQVPGVAPSDYALGAAAIDTELRAKMQENAGASLPVVESGKALWSRKFRNGRTLASCFPNGGRRVAATYPLYDSRLKRVVTLETAINQCLKANGEPLYDLADPQTMGVVAAYLRSLADGQKVAVRMAAGAEERFEEGRRLYFTRLGQRNFACASCHVQSAGRRYGDQVLSPAIGQATHWPLVRGGRAITLQARMRECLELMGAAPFPAGADELNHLELFLTYLSNGLTLRANAWRPG